MPPVPQDNRRTRDVAVVDRQRSVRLAGRAVRSLAAFVLAREHVGAPMGVNLVFVGARAMCRFNRDYTGRPHATDVLSFPAQPPLRAAPADTLTIGDVIVSAECAAAYARTHGLPVDEELARYIVHGILHCLGYDDGNDSTRVAMTARQELLLRQWRAAYGGRVCRGAGRST